MASDDIVNTHDLLLPISEENPIGDDIREDTSASSPYQTIRDARNAARNAERKNIFDDNNPEANDLWRKIILLAPKILTENAKDLEIASMYSEALIRIHGFQGLKGGFELIHGLIEQYWDGLYPLPDEDGIETRVASLAGLNGEGAEGVLIPPIRNSYITQGSDPAPFSLGRYQQALEVEKAIDEETRSSKASKLGFSVTDVDKAVNESSETFFIDLRDDLNSCIKTYTEIGRLLDENCGLSDAPSTKNIITILEECLGGVKHIGKYKFPSEEISADENNQDVINDSESQMAQTSGSVKNRAEAFKKLTEISEYFRKTEPHSPISYILKRAIKWGDMPLEDLMKELIPDSSARGIYGSLTGIQTDDDK